MEEEQSNRVRIIDIAEELGVSTATVSNVINGKTKKISDKTVEKVQKKLEEKNYIPNMAAVLLAQNSSKIICVIISDHDKYEGNVIQDPFVSSLLDKLEMEIEKNNYFMMVKKTSNINEVVKYASMWNMAGLVLIGFCDQDYDKLRKCIHIPFVVMDGFFEPQEKCANIGIDDFMGGYIMGKYFISQGHSRVMYVSDNDMCMDHNRYIGLKEAFKDSKIDLDNVKLEIIPMKRNERFLYYKTIKKKIRDVTAIFCASDAYAIEIMNYLTDNGYSIPDDVSIAGFDDIPASTIVRPALTTIKQDIGIRAEYAVRLLNELVRGCVEENNVILPVELVERDSVKLLKDVN